MENVSMEELDNILEDDNSQLIDIRDNYLYEVGTIPTAINAPSNFLQMMPEKYLRKGTHYYLFCDYGIKSRKVARYLNALGYDVKSIDGGYNSYNQ